MFQPEPQSRSFDDMIHGIEKGTLKIPQFQRNFVWSKSKSAKLIDSILKGYPIGTLILWKTKEQLRTVREIGGVKLPPTPKGDYVEQVLDGQQRLTSLYASVRGLNIERDNKIESYEEMYVDLDIDPEIDIPLVVTSTNGDEDEGRFVRLVDVLKGEFDLLKTLRDDRRERLQAHKKRMENYRFSIILIQDAPIDVATEIFTRINVTGQPLSVFEIMVAKTFDHGSGLDHEDSEFDLAKRYQSLANRLSEVNYGTVPASSMLQLASLLMVGECRKKDILKLPTDDFRKLWPNVEDAVERACDYFRSFFRIPVSKLLPYAALIVPFGYYFAKHPDRPTGADKNYLRELFWRISLSGRYTSGVESKLAQDVLRVKKILDEKEPDYDFGVNISPETIINQGVFRTGSSFIKAILCLYAFQKPRSFVDDSIVTLSNEWLKQANSRNYHHFFPKAYLNKKNYERWEINHIVNITIVDDFLNKKKIKTRAPSDYMAEFEKSNTELVKTMKTHLIDLDTFGIWDDDYDLFFEKRCQLIARKLRKWVPERKIDATGGKVVEDDIDPDDIDDSADSVTE